MSQQFLFLYLMIYVISVFLMTCSGMSTYDAMQIITAFLSNVALDLVVLGLQMPLVVCLIVLNA